MKVIATPQSTLGAGLTALVHEAHAWMALSTGIAYDVTCISALSRLICLYFFD